ncbi:MAG: aminopeptidase P family protein, partial [Patescibacteria group bacterium]
MSKPDAKLITNKSNIAYLSNFTGSAGFMLLTKKNNYLFTDFRYIERAKSTIPACIKLINITRVWRNPKALAETWQKILKKHKIKILGIEESDLTVARYKKFKKISKKIKFVDISGEIEKIREIKTPKEIALIIKSQRINERVFLAIKKIIQDYCQTAFSKSSSIEPLREIDIAWMIKKLAHDFGADDISFDPIVSFGPHSARPHHEPDATKLKKGDIIMIDMGMKYKGYCSDMTRMIFTSKPTQKQTQIYDLVLKAQENAIKKIKAGISGKKADALSRDIINKAGFKEQYGHAGGHGIGLDVHEIPSLAETYKNPLKPNSIVTVEPGIYLEGEFGIRIEDMILVTKQVNKNLTKIP